MSSPGLDHELDPDAVDNDKDSTGTASEEETSQIRSTLDGEGVNRLILSGVIDAYLGDELHRRALDLLQSGRDITLDLSKVESMDVCAMQILLALRGDLASLGRTLGLFAASENAARSLRMAGISGILAAA